MVRNEALLISTAGAFNDPTCALLINWFQRLAIIRANDDDTLWKLASEAIANEPLRQRIVEFSRHADFGIDDIRKQGDMILSLHNVYDSQGRPSGLASARFEDVESDGTVKFFQLAAPAINALDNGTTLVVDELDSRMHPNLTQKIISFFNSPTTNPRNAQLIFTLHDVGVMSARTLRRDQVWFAEKNSRGESRLFSLSDFNVRANSAFGKDYLQGLYGAIPVFGNFEEMFDSEEIAAL